MEPIHTLHSQACQLINERKFIQAHPLLVQVVRRQPQHADSYFLLGIINLEIGQVGKAVKLIEKAMAIQTTLEYRVYLLKAYALQGDATRVAQLTSQMRPQRFTSALLLDTAGVALSHVGHHVAAIEYFKQAIRLDGRNPEFFYNLGVSFKFIGDFEGAKQAFTSALKFAPEHSQTLFSLSDLGMNEGTQKRLQHLQACLDKQSNADSILHLSHAMAKEYEAQDKYLQAFECLKTAKKIKLDTLDYQFSDDKNVFATVYRLAKRHQGDSAGGFDSNAPIFIVGMPRSGTTLLDRILSQHSKVTSAGELHDFGAAVKEVTKTAGSKALDIATLEAAYRVSPVDIGQRYIEKTKLHQHATGHFIDKLPFNFFYLDLIRKALPNAKVLCMLRHPMDTCVGNYRQLFSLSNPYFHYAYDLETTGNYYTEFCRLVEHWQQLHREHLMCVQYEELVAKPEHHIRQILSFCELDWQDQCVQVEKNTSPVSSASKVQVREPINQSSVGRWQRYKPLTDELEKLLSANGML